MITIFPRRNISVSVPGGTPVNLEETTVAWNPAFPSRNTGRELQNTVPPSFMASSKLRPGGGGIRISMICNPKIEPVWRLPTLKLLPVLAELFYELSVTRPEGS